VTVIGFYICFCIPNYIKIRRFFTAIWRFNSFQNSGCPPSRILNICSFCHVAFVGMPFCCLVQNFAEIGQSADKLWPKKRFSRWRPPQSWVLKISIFCHMTVIGFNICYSVSNFIKYRFFTGDMATNDFQNGGRPLSWILKICSFCHVAFDGMPFCCLVQNFAQIAQSVDELWPKKAIFKMAAAGFHIWCSVPNFIKIGRFFHWDMAI